MKLEKEHLKLSLSYSQIHTNSVFFILCCLCCCQEQIDFVPHMEGVSIMSLGMSVFLHCLGVLFGPRNSVFSGWKWALPFHFSGFFGKGGTGPGSLGVGPLFGLLLGPYGGFGPGFSFSRRVSGHFS